MDYDVCIKEIKEALNFTHGIISSSTYSNARRQLAMIYFNKGEEIEGIYNLTESHGIGLRLAGITQSARSSDSLPYSDYLSFEKGYAKDETKGMLQRLKEMPSEWTIVQLTREFDNDPFKIRVAETSPVLKGFYLTRLPCGSEFDIGCPVMIDREWPENAEQEDIIADFWKIKKQLGSSAGSASRVRKLRMEAALDVEVKI